MLDKGYKSRIDKLKRRLYSRKKFMKYIPSSTFSFKKRNFDIKSDWEKTSKEKISQEIPPFFEGESKKQEEQMKKKKNKISVINKVLIGTFLFLIIAIGFTYFSIVGNRNRISSDNINITLSGPILINAGEILSFDIKVANNNNVDLVVADLLIEYPEGARDPENVKSTIKRYRKTLGNIKKGEQKQEEVNVILFGEEGSTKEIVIGVEYRILDSNAIFFTERKYEVEINTSPISVDISSQKEIESGQDIEFAIEIRSNSEKDLENVIINAEYPFGFVFNESTPVPINGDRTWKIQKLKSGEKKVVTINGKMEGQDGDTRFFRFNVGLGSKKVEDEIDVVFVSRSKSVVIKRSFIGLDVTVNGSLKKEQIARGSDQIRVDISWRNNLPVKIQNGVVEVKLEGEMIDKSSIVSSNGFYRSSDNKILWDKRSNNELGVIETGKTGTMSFSFLVKEPSSIIERNIKNAEINIDTSFFGDRVDENIENISSNTKNNIKISSYTSLTPKVTHFDGNFINTGPLPPKVDAETTYTIIFSLSNLINNVSGSVLKATLPPYVRWIGVYSPSGEDVSYNPVGGEIRWEVGDIYSGTGYTEPSKELQFQIALTPSTSLVGKTPKLVQDIKFSGLDTFTDTTIEIQKPDIDTRFRLDSQFKEAMARVVQ